MPTALWCWPAQQRPEGHAVEALQFQQHEDQPAERLRGSDHDRSRRLADLGRLEMAGYRRGLVTLKCRTAGGIDNEAIHLASPGRGQSFDDDAVPAEQLHDSSLRFRNEIGGG